jgi:hypothetical protein
LESQFELFKWVPEKEYSCLRENRSLKFSGGLLFPARKTNFFFFPILSSSFPQMPQKKQQPSANRSDEKINDPRFKKVHNDPRFLRPKKKDTKVTIDKRFKSMLTSKDFGTGAGRKCYKRIKSRPMYDELIHLHTF